jgi:hypothetical protein
MKIKPSIVLITVLTILAFVLVIVDSQNEPYNPI